MKIKPILPSLREKKRYLAYKIISKVNHDPKDITKAIKKAVKAFIGTLGSSKAGILHLEDKYDSKDKTGIIRVNNKYVTHLRSSLLFIELDNVNTIFQSLNTSGILKKLKRC